MELVEEIPRLTARQAEFLAMTANGLTQREIAAEVFVERWTIEDRLAEARARLKAKTTAHAIVLAISQELLILTHDGRVVVPHPHRFADAA